MKLSDKVKAERAKPKASVILSQNELRHLIKHLMFKTRGCYHPETDQWTYPQDITEKLCKALI